MLNTLKKNTDVTIMMYTVMPLWVFGEFMDDFLLVSEKKMKPLLCSQQ